ncbi:MAG: response regulator [Armatimonadota bacterium]|jgi:CheY-like chemotaxis protein
MDKASILVVDDDEYVRSTLSDMLECIGHDVVAAADALGAVAEASDQSFDVVLIDVRMPGHDGLDTLRMLRGLMPAGHCVMMTGFVDPGMEAACLQAGAEACMRKPLELDTIHALVDRLLGDPHAA